MGFSIIAGMILGSLFGGFVIYCLAILTGIEEVTYGRAVLCAIICAFLEFVLALVTGVLLAMVLIPFGIEEPPEILLTIIEGIIGISVFVFCCIIVFQCKLKQAIVLAIVLYIFNYALQACLSIPDQPESVTLIGQALHLV